MSQDKLEFQINDFREKTLLLKMIVRVKNQEFLNL